MRIQKQRVTCLKKSCGAVTDCEIVVDCRVELFNASLKLLACGKCGSKKVGMGGGDPIDAMRAATGPSVSERSAHWIRRGEVGLSSETIWRTLSGMFGTDNWRPEIPYDPDDFRRCRLLLQLIPEWKADLPKVADKFPMWKPFVESWDRFDALFTEEAPSGACPKLYDEMQKAVAEASRLRQKAPPQPEDRL